MYSNNKFYIFLKYRNVIFDFFQKPRALVLGCTKSALIKDAELDAFHAVLHGSRKNAIGVRQWSLSDTGTPSANSIDHANVRINYVSI
jgi:hypothetical protein